uniref:Uncharacterized protein n=1 Tax=Anguilla anguilla TaxID=7936 RepID=A0A0E9Q5I3_ANGAN
MIHKHTMLVNMANSTYIKQHLFSFSKNLFYQQLAICISHTGCDGSRLANVSQRCFDVEFHLLEQSKLQITRFIRNSSFNDTFS